MVHRCTCRKDTCTHEINKSKISNAGSSSAGGGGQSQEGRFLGLDGQPVPSRIFCPKWHIQVHPQTCTHTDTGERQTGGWESSGHRGRSGRGLGPVTMVVPAHSRLRGWPVTNDLKLSIECSLRRAVLIASLRCRGASGLWGGSCCSPGSSPPVPNPCH